MHRVWMCLAVLGCAAVAQGDDWPQWMGPKRDNVWRETGLVDQLPKEPKIVWRAPVAGGYSGPAVVGGKVYVTDYVTSESAKTDNFDRKEFTGVERLTCLDEKTGKKLWSEEHPEKYTISYPAGPRSTPIVHEGKVYVQGAEGMLACLNAARGDVLWNKSLKETYQTKAALWGYASQPLIDGKKLIVIAGGAGSHGVALNKDTGKEIWRTGTAKEQGYSPPVIIEQAGVRQLVLCTPESIYAVNPETGEQLWLVEYEGSNGSIIMTPIHHGNHLYVGGWDKKSIMIELGSDKPTAKTVWRDKDEGAISAVNVQPFLMGDKVYGVDQSGELRCMDLPGGEIRWTTPQPLSERKVPSGTVFLVRGGDSDKFWMFAETGDLIIGQLSTDGFKELSRTHVIDATNTAFGRDVVWCAPAFANKRMYVRNDKELICVDLAK